MTVKELVELDTQEALQVDAEYQRGAEWSPTRRELFYRSGTQMMAVDVGLGATFTAGRPYELFEDTYARDGSGALALPFYDVAADGERFIMVQPSEAQGLTRFTVVVNWFEELKRLVPIP